MRKKRQKVRETKHDRARGKASDRRHAAILASRDLEVVDPVITRLTVTHPHDDGETAARRTYERWPGPEAWEPSSSWLKNRTFHAGRTAGARPGGFTIDLALPALTNSYVERVDKAVDKHASAVKAARWLGLGLEDSTRQTAEPRFILDKVTDPPEYVVEVYGCPFTSLDAGFELWIPNNDGDPSFWVSPTTGFWGYGPSLIEVWLSVTSLVANKIWFEAACIPEMRASLNVDWRLAWERIHGDGYWFPPLYPNQTYTPRPLHPDYAEPTGD